MKTIRIIARDFAKDLTAGVGDAVLLQKYGLTVTGLLKVKKELVAKGILSADDTGPLQKVRRSRLIVDENDFLESFSAQPDDYHLMSKYFLTPDRLKKIYAILIQKGLLSEYELNTRIVKAPEIDDGPDIDVDLTSLTWETGPIDMTGYSTEIRNFMMDLADDDGTYVRPNEGPNKPEADSCPKCGHPKDPAMPESCARCGIVYVKLPVSSVRGSNPPSVQRYAIR